MNKYPNFVNIFLYYILLYIIIYNINFYFAGIVEKNNCHTVTLLFLKGGVGNKSALTH